MGEIFELAIGGRRYSQFTSWSIDSSYKTPADSWECVAYSIADPAGLRTTFEPLQEVSVLVSGRVQCVGRIGVTQSAGPNGVALSVQGLDYIGPMVAGGIDPTISVKKGETIERVLMRAFEPWGITKVSGDGFAKLRNAMTGVTRGQAVPRDFRALSVEDVKAQENSGAWRWASGIVARHGFTIQPTLDRNELAVDAPDYSQETIGTLYRDRAGKRGNVLTGTTAKRDWQSVPSATIARGRGVASGTKAGSLGAVVPTFGPGSLLNLGNSEEVKRIAARMHSGRIKPGDPPTELYYAPLYYRDKDAKNQAQLDSGLRRMLSDKAMNTLTYTAKVRGVTDIATGAVYAVGSMVRVVDEIENIDESLWIEERRLEQSQGSTPTATLKLIRPGSYVL